MEGGNMDIKRLSFADLYAAHEMSLGIKKQQAGLFNASDQEKFLEAIRTEFLRRQSEILNHKKPKLDELKKETHQEVCENILRAFDNLKAKYKVGKPGYPLKVNYERKKAIKELFDKGFTKDDIWLVMRTRFADGGPKPSEHEWLNPETMFRPKNFSRYLSQADVIAKKIEKVDQKEDWTS